MGLLDGKTALIFGVANDHSIAWGITQALHREGATIGLSYAGEVLERRVKPLAASIGVDFVEPCDVSSDEEIRVLMEKARQAFGGIDISVYSLIAVAHAALPIMRDNSSILTLTYLGSVRAFPNYNVMGVAKAALEASVRYLALDLGASEKHIRVNAISAGPIRTLSAAGVSGFKGLHSRFREIAPLRRNIGIEEVGNAAAYLGSDLSAGVTGEVHYVDAGYNIVGLPIADDSS